MSYAKLVDQLEKAFEAYNKMLEDGKITRYEADDLTYKATLSALLGEIAGTLKDIHHDMPAKFKKVIG